MCPFPGPHNIITYKLTDNSIPSAALDLFKIGSSNGLFQTKVFLDDSTKGCYTLEVQCENAVEGSQSFTDVANITVCILDQNESPSFDESFYKFSIAENEPAGNGTQG